MQRQMIPDESEVECLLVEDHDALMATLGLQSIALVSASAALKSLRDDEVGLHDVPALGRKRESEHLINLAQSFLKDWASELGNAVCKNEKLYEEEKRHGLEQTHLFVAAVVGAVVGAVPALAAMSGLLTVLGVLVAKTGIETFCKRYLCGCTLREVDSCQTVLSLK